MEVYPREVFYRVLYIIAKIIMCEIIVLINVLLKDRACSREEDHMFEIVEIQCRFCQVCHEALLRLVNEDNVF